jgi:hypothetical protein
MPYTMNYLCRAFPNQADRDTLANWMAVVYRSLILHKSPGHRRVGPLFLRSSAEARSELEWFTCRLLGKVFLTRRLELCSDFEPQAYDVADESHEFAVAVRAGKPAYMRGRSRYRGFLVVLGADVAENSSFMLFHDPNMNSPKERKAIMGEATFLARCLFDYFGRAAKPRLTRADRKAAKQEETNDGNG